MIGRVAAAVLVAGLAPAWAGDPVAPEALLALEGDREYGAYLAAECLTCHSADGEDRGIPGIAGWPREATITALYAYRIKAREHAAMRMIAGRLSDEEIAALALYFEGVD